MKKRVLSLLLVFGMLCSLSTALAAGRVSSFSGLGRTKTYTGQFSDVSESIWYYDCVASAYELGLMEGKSGSTFSPNGTLTVAEALVLACRVLSLYTGDGTVFVEGSPWYAVYVDYAVEQGLIARDQFSSYGKAATRAEVAAILGTLPSTMLSPINEVQNNAIPDVSPGSSYYSEVYTLYRAGVLDGTDSQGSFQPDSSIRRSEAAAIVVRLAEPAQRQHFALTAQPVTLYADNGARISVTPGEAAAYEILGWRTAPFTVSPDDGAEAILNAATLRSVRTGTESLDTLVDNILAEILTDGMSTYDKVRACYDYLIAGAKSGSSGIPRSPGSGSYQNSGDYMLSLRAQSLLESGIGSAEDYAAAFLVMTRRIGLTCYVFTGEISQASGYGPHTWNVISVGGTDYVFDVYTEDSLTGSGQIQYARFCKTFDQLQSVYRGYSAETAKAAFGGFMK